MIPIPRADTGSLQLWWTDLDATPPAPGADQVLSADERARAARFVQPVHRRRFTAAHAALRSLLASRTGVAPDALVFDVARFGKPALRGPAGCAFNLSHSDHLAVVALAEQGDIGVDVELLRDMPDADALARHHFTVEEQAELARAPAPHRTLAFLHGWTRKEACLKAIGCGLQVDPHTFHVGLGPEARTVPVAAPDGTAVVTVASFVHHGLAVVSWARVLPAATTRPEPFPSA